MDDLAKQLRELANRVYPPDNPTGDLLLQAASELDQLKKKLAQYQFAELRRKRIYDALNDE